MEDMICKVCGSHHFKKITDTEYQCENCGFTRFTNKTSKEEVSLIEAYNALNIGDYIDAEERFSFIYDSNKESYEALWGKIVSNYGIVFVNNDGKIYPTFHGFSDESFIDDKLYKEFLRIVPSNKKDIYISLASKIEKLRKKYFELVRSEKDYDIFISFKQTDEKGNKTDDYYQAKDLYYNLKDKGYRVFFSEVTLNNLSGEEYEPFIYHALRTAKVLIVYGQKKEYFESIWVKNEWGRYLKMIDNNQKKQGSLIVCIENMNAYNLPVKLRNLQVIDFTDNKRAYEMVDNSINRIITKDNINDDIKEELDINKELNKIRILIDFNKKYNEAAELTFRLLSEGYETYQLWYYYLKAITKEFIDTTNDNISLCFDNLYRLVEDRNKEELDNLNNKLNTEIIKQRKLEEEKRKQEEQRKLEENKNILENTFNSLYKKDGDFIYFGSYPQTIMDKRVKILEKVNYNKREYYLGSDKAVYVKTKANQKNKNYTFSNGEEVVKDNEYYFKVEPVKWKILSQENGEYFIFTDCILNAHRFDSSSNNYYKSEIKNYLNNEMYNEMFSNEQKELILETKGKNIEIEKVKKLFKTIYVNKETIINLGKLFLLNKEEITKTSYDFNPNAANKDNARRKQVTDYAVANYAWYDTDKEKEYLRNGWYWLRTPEISPSGSPYAYLVPSYGNVFYDGVTDDAIGLAPALKITTR